MSSEVKPVRGRVSLLSLRGVPAWGGCPGMLLELGSRILLAGLGAGLKRCFVWRQSPWQPRCWLPEVPLNGNELGIGQQNNERRDGA